MKIKTIIISAAVAAGCIGGIAFGSRAIMQRSIEPVQVAPVMNIRMDPSWLDYEDTSITGNIFSTDTQNIDLLREEGVYLKDVKVSEGDTVKKGDTLLEYDMTLIELQKELEDLNHQLLELKLQKSEKTLETLLKNPGGAAALALLDTGEEDDDDMTASADTLIDEESVSNDVIAEGDSSYDDVLSDDAPSDETYLDPEDEYDIDDAMIWDEDAQNEDPSLIHDDLYVETESIEPETGGEGQGQTESGGGSSSGRSPVEELIDVRDPDRAKLEELTSEQQDINDNALDFVKRVNAMNGSGVTPDQVEQDYINETFRLFESGLAQPAENASEENVWYVLKSEVVEALTAKAQTYSTETFDYPVAMQVSLFRAYGNLCLFDLQKKMNTLETALAAIDTSDPQQLKTLQPQIAEASGAYLKLQRILAGLQAELVKLGEDVSAETLVDIYQSHLIAYGGENMNLYDPAGGSLSRIISWLSIADERIAEQESEDAIPLVEDPEPPTEAITEAFEDFTEDFDYDDFDDFDEDFGYTQEELDAEIQAVREEIAETNLDIRESELKLKQFDRILEKKVVVSAMDGIVRSASDNENDSSDQYFMVISGKEGMYVRGSVNELTRDTIKIGDKLKGLCYENDQSFTATVTEISEYPVTDEDEFMNFGWSSENPNASSYPFVAYIEGDQGVIEGYAEMSFVKTEDRNADFYIEKLFIRTDTNGSDYVYIRGEDGLLKKQVVKTGKSLWGGYTQILSGLSPNDMIAVPYGKNVGVGAKTLEVEALDY